MGKFRSVAGWAIVAAWAASGCSTVPTETDANGSEVTTRRNNSKAEQSYVAGDPSSDGTSLPPTDAEVSQAVQTSGDVVIGPDAGVDSFTASDHSATDHSATDHSATDHSATATVLVDAGGTTMALEESSATTDSTAPASSCHPTAGLCDPVGPCALSECDFEHTGKSCGYTPERIYPFMCVGNADYEPYRPCDADDVCAPGSVCISKATWLKDGSFSRRSLSVCRETCRQDADCGEAGWCAQATDDNNEPIADLRVCHRHCNSASDCYVGEGDEDVRCSNSVEGAPPSMDECSRYRPPATPPPPSETTDGVTQTATESTPDLLDTGGGSTSALSLRAYLLQADTAECAFDEDCPDDGVCIDNTCHSRCEADEDCGGAECVVVNGRGVCGAPCEKPEGAACGLLPTTCGCALGETCQLGKNFEPTCVAPGRNRAMTWCNSSQDCDTGLSCIAGLCRPLCDPLAHPCEPVDGECLLGISREDGDIYACAGSCDPVTAPTCGEGAVCLPGFDSERHHHALCAAERTAQRPRMQGEACDEDYDCATGLGCDVNATCQPWCRDDADCSDGDSCKLDASNLGPTLTRFGSFVDDAIGLCQASR